ncbi:MAG: ABC transporter permease [Desulfobacteraceae bacterium]|nr:ABC transporter permease [Desulfobacteraceae bacterium]
MRIYDLVAHRLVFFKMSPIFVLNETLIRFTRNGIMVLALVIPITAGMGLNFAISVGAICAQIGVLLVLDYQISGFSGLMTALSVGLALSFIAGILIGLCLNKAKGSEMIASMIIGFLATGMYQLIFMVGYGTVITPHNQEIVLSGGIGIRGTVDLARIRNIIDRWWLIRIGEIEVPLFMILFVICLGLMIKYLMNTRLGQQFRAVGMSEQNAEMLGSDVNSIRLKAILFSTLIACVGQIVFIQNIGMMNVYTAHLNSDIFSCAAILAGGASIRNARIRHAFIGILLFHSLFIVSPQAGQNIFRNAAFGEYFRSFAAYGTIAFALIYSSKNSDWHSADQHCKSHSSETYPPPIHH